MRLRKYQVGILGALNGLLFSIVLIFYIKQYGRYLEWRNIEDARLLGESPPQLWAPSPNALTVSLLLIPIFAGTSLLVYQVVPKVREKIILFWLIAGILSILAWNLLLLSMGFVDGLHTGRSPAIDIAVIMRLVQGPMSFALVILLNSLYGSAIRLLTPSRQVSKQ